MHGYHHKKTNSSESHEGNLMDFFTFFFFLYLMTHCKVFVIFSGIDIKYPLSYSKNSYGQFARISIFIYTTKKTKGKPNNEKKKPFETSCIHAIIESARIHQSRIRIFCNSCAILLNVWEHFGVRMVTKTFLFLFCFYYWFFFFFSWTTYILYFPFYVI